MINATTLEVCRSHQGICIDLDRELKFSLEDYYDFAHTTPKGAIQIADFLFEKLVGIVGVSR